MPLYRRLPKRGFVPHGGRTVYVVVNLEALGGVGPNAVVDPESLPRARLIKGSARSRVKILGEGGGAHALAVRAHAGSGSARAKIAAKGGRGGTLGGEVTAS